MYQHLYPSGCVLQCLVGALVGLIMFDLIRHGTAGTVPSHETTHMSWRDGYEYCKESNLSLPSPNNTLSSNITEFPVWTFGLVVTRIYRNGDQRQVTIMSLPTHMYARSCCVNYTDICIVIEPNQWTYSDAKMNCESKQTNMSTIVGDSVNVNFKLGNVIRHSYWAETVNVSSLFEGYNISTECIVADSSGTLMIDDCDTKHRVACIQENSKPTFYPHHVNDSQRFPLYKPTSPSPSAGTTTLPSGSSFIPTEGKGTSSSVPTTERNYTNNITNEQGDQGLAFSSDAVFVIAGIGGVVVLIVIIIGICCYCCRRKRNETDKTIVFDAYSEAPDSIVFKEKEDNVVYATPEDALGLKKAKHRDSITEDEYDVLKTGSKPDKDKHVNTGNVYSHIPVGFKKGKMASTETVDDTYDVTNHNIGTQFSRKDVECDTYEHIEPKR